MQPTASLTSGTAPPAGCVWARTRPCYTPQLTSRPCLTAKRHTWTARTGGPSTPGDGNQSPLHSGLGGNSRPGPTRPSLPSPPSHAEGPAPEPGPQAGAGVAPHLRAALPSAAPGDPKPPGCRTQSSVGEGQAQGAPCSPRRQPAGHTGPSSCVQAHTGRPAPAGGRLGGSGSLALGEVTDAPQTGLLPPNPPADQLAVHTAPHSLPPCISTVGQGPGGHRRTERALHTHAHTRTHQCPAHAHMHAHMLQCPPTPVPPHIHMHAHMLQCPPTPVPPHIHMHAHMLQCPPTHTHQCPHTHAHTHTAPAPIHTGALLDARTELWPRLPRAGPPTQQACEGPGQTQGGRLRFLDSAA
nr:transcription initiation factor TFIID subunit 4-like [Oryctolagus cuniculus]